MAQASLLLDCKRHFYPINCRICHIWHVSPACPRAHSYAYTKGQFSSKLCHNSLSSSIWPLLIWRAIAYDTFKAGFHTEGGRNWEFPLLPKNLRGKICFIKLIQKVI